MKKEFYRFKYMRRNIISAPFILFILFLIVDSIAFNWYVFLFTLIIYGMFLYMFLKICTPWIYAKIIIDGRGIEWILKEKQLALFPWDDIKDIVKTRYSNIQTFELVLPDEIRQKVNLTVFRFDSTKEILELMQSSCTNIKLLDAMKVFN